MTIKHDYYIESGITDGSDTFSCRICGWNIHPWMLGCEACGADIAKAIHGQRYECFECGQQYYDETMALDCCMHQEEEE